METLQNLTSFEEKYLQDKLGMNVDEVRTFLKTCSENVKNTALGSIEYSLFFSKIAQYCDDMVKYTKKCLNDKGHQKELSLSSTHTLKPNDGMVMIARHLRLLVKDYKERYNRDFSDVLLEDEKNRLKTKIDTTRKTIETLERQYAEVQEK